METALCRTSAGFPSSSQRAPRRMHQRERSKKQKRPSHLEVFKFKPDCQPQALGIVPIALQLILALCRTFALCVVNLDSEYLDAFVRSRVEHRQHENMLCMMTSPMVTPGLYVHTYSYFSAPATSEASANTRDRRLTSGGGFNPAALYYTLPSAATAAVHLLPYYQTHAFPPPNQPIKKEPSHLHHRHHPSHSRTLSTILLQLHHPNAIETKT